VVKYYAAGAVKRIARQLKIAKERAPEAGLTFPFSMSPKLDSSFGKRNRETDPVASIRAAT